MAQTSGPKSINQLTNPCPDIVQLSRETPLSSIPPASQLFPEALETVDQVEIAVDALLSIFINTGFFNFYLISGTCMAKAL